MLSRIALSLEHPVGPARRWLIVEPLPRGARSATVFAAGDLVVHMRYEHLEAGLLARIAPCTVLAPLIAPGWDILDLATRLERLGWRGVLVAQSRPLPCADLVLGEIQSLFPAQRISLLQLA
jgi:hypothetical protein